MLLALAACGGGGGSPAPDTSATGRDAEPVAGALSQSQSSPTPAPSPTPSPPPPVSGVVAAGLAFSSATVRVLDPTGKAIATDKPVMATSGAYGPITLTGTGPSRVEACGTVADKRCASGVWL